LHVAARAASEPQRTRDHHYVMRRAALLHADVAMSQPHAAVEPFDARSRPTVGPATWRIDILDGRGLDAGLTALHWDIARLVLDQFRPDPMVRAWYRATAAWMQMREDHDTLHLDHGRGIFPDDADLLFLSGCQRETYADPAIQAAARSVVLPDGLRVGVESERGELRLAESFFRRAVARQPDMGEAHLRLGRVLSLLGRHGEAAEEIARALPLIRADDDLRYYGELFAGAEEQALGRLDAARAAYERASALFPLAQSPYVALSELAHRRADRAAAVAAIEKVFALPSAIDGGRDDPWWRYHVAQARNADDLIEALRAPFRQAPE
jgi:tetratricopeptide (TPR) repeat protein